VKTTLEIPDALFRRAKSTAAELGIPLRQFISDALSEKLRVPSSSEEKPWMKTFGALRHLHGETVQIDRLVEDEFGTIEPEDWR
jgi:hypothetical protein